MSNQVLSRLHRAVLPLSVFASALAAHYIWFVISGGSAGGAESGCGSCGSSCAPAPSILSQYFATQSYWLGYSIALPLSFAATALRSNMETKSRAAKGAVFGGVSLSAILGFAGCYLSGCCGSPMLAVYVSLLGAAFLPFAKPMVALITTLSILGSLCWLQRSASKQTCSINVADPCCDPGTQC